MDQAKLIRKHLNKSNVSYAGLAGATADVHCYDVLTNKWARLTPYGEPPSPRAAHVATAVGTMVVIQVRGETYFVCVL
ncbi:hypothetical protein YC2023_050749 [Brassica napus]